MARGVIGVSVAVLLAALAGCERGANPGDSAADPREVTFETASGRTISGHFYGVDGLGAPGVVLIHDVGSTRAAWGGFPERIQASGYACIAIDLAGHGTSEGGPAGYRTFSEADWRGRVEDVAAARRVLIDAGCDERNIGVIGAGIGGGIGLAAAARGDAASVVLISSELERHGFALLTLISELRTVPVLVLASEGDSAAVAAGERLQAAAPGFCEYRAYAGSRSGAGLIAGSENAALQVLQWLEQTLPQ